MGESFLRRRQARLAAVQGVYAQLVGSAPLGRLMEALEGEHLGLLEQQDDTVTSLPVDRTLARLLLSTALEQREALLLMASDNAKVILKMEPLLQAIMLTALAEFRAVPGQSKALTVHEYTTIAAGFFDREESGLVNAILDHTTVPS